MEYPTDAAEKMRLWLQTDLRTAMKQRRQQDVATLRCLIAALDNAGAVRVEPAQRDYRRTEGQSQYVATGSGDGPTEVPRKSLSDADVDHLLREEYEARRNAADQLESVGKPAELLRSEAALVARYIRPCA